MADGIRALYVDDEIDLLDLGKIYLEESGDFSVDTVTSAAEALDILNRNQYDAIVADYQMPKMDGIEFLKRVRAANKTIPFILFTGRGREEVVIDALNNGADFYVQKGGDAASLFMELGHKIRQIVQMRRTERSLAENREYLDRIFSSVQSGIVVIDAKTHEILDLNPAAAGMMGTTKDQIVGKKCHRFICPAEEGQCPITDLHKTVDNSERVLLTADGKKLDIIKYVVPFRLNGRECLLETFLDNTERKRATDELQSAYEEITATDEELRQNYNELSKQEQALRESEEKFRVLVEHSLDGILITDFTGTLLFANPTAGCIVDVPDIGTRVKKINIQDFMVPESRAAMLEDIGRVGQGIDALLTRYKLITATKRECWVECTGTKIPFEGSTAILVSMRDVTSRTLDEEALRTAHKKLNILSNITRHDIVRTLFALNRSIGSLKKTIADKPEALETLERIRAASNQIDEQIRFTGDYQDLGISTPVWQNIQTIARMAAHDKLPAQVTLDIATGDYEIFADPMLMMVFYNLYDNACRHGETVTKIAISFSERDNRGILVIADNGVGIPGDLRGTIFDKGVGKNTGFGLFLAREILAITGLSIAETGTTGNGARFEIVVPPGRYRLKNPDRK
jgi:PAS domain S-box-containing protein